MAQRVFTFSKAGHTIKIECSLLGKETVYYDEAEVASGWSATGGDYVFSVEEDRKNAEYRVQIRFDQSAGRIIVEVLKNNARIFSS
jgi:hypothetical protein